MNYTTWSDDELIEALWIAGRKPERELIQACLQRRDSLTPTLLDLILDEGDYEWEDEDPRWYIGIHAGLLLIAFREPEAIPIFMDILCDDWYDNLMDWFASHLHHYGPAIVPSLAQAITDEEGYIEGRLTAIEILVELASRFPETRQQSIALLRTLLPQIKDGAVDVDNPSEEDIRVWTCAAEGLGDLGDRRSLPVVEALHKAKLIDEIVYGDFDDYKREFFSPKGFRLHHRKAAFDIFEAYGYRD
ncbi:MAG: DUF1186 domain-containing protein [Caldilineaceae bacterium]|nr:DUF1186 domain-containing protein [Caldilineaceae bacterium]